MDKKERKYIDRSFLAILAMLSLMMFYGHKKRVVLNIEKTILMHKRDSLTNVISFKDSLYKWKQVRFNKRLEIDIRQNNIIDRFRSSRNAKLKDKRLMELMFEIE